MVDDILVTGFWYVIPDMNDKIDGTFTLEAVVHGSGPMCSFGIILFQNEDMTVEFNAEDKLNGISFMRISRCRGGETDRSTNQLKHNIYASVNASVG